MILTILSISVVLFGGTFSTNTGNAVIETDTLSRDAYVLEIKGEEGFIRSEKINLM